MSDFCHCKTCRETVKTAIIAFVAFCDARNKADVWGIVVENQIDKLDQWIDDFLAGKVEANA